MYTISEGHTSQMIPLFNLGVVGPSYNYQRHYENKWHVLTKLTINHKHFILLLVLTSQPNKSNGLLLRRQCCNNVCISYYRMTGQQDRSIICTQKQNNIPLSKTRPFYLIILPQKFPLSFIIILDIDINVVQRI